MVDVVTWDEFVDSFQWKQGEHVGMIGPTGSGKTTLALSLLPIRKYVCVFATKPRDTTLDSLVKDSGYKKIARWRTDLSPQNYPRRILWPNARSLYAAGKQKRIFREGFELIYDQGNWCVYLDELWMMANFLQLGFEVKVYLQQARSLGISLVCATQRPAWVPLELYDQSSHLFFWRDNDERNLSRLSGISWLNADHVRATIANLDVHEVLYICTRNSSTRMMRFMPPPPGKG
jgi:energy-coupling factor transporter ATP-binding protein EcfA2